MIYPKDILINEACVISFKPPKALEYYETAKDDVLIINRYYGSRSKGGYTIYYAFKYGKHFHFKIRNCKHIYKPKDITKEVEDFIYKMGVFKLK